MVRGNQASAQWLDSGFRCRPKTAGLSIPPSPTGPSVPAGDLGLVPPTSPSRFLHLNYSPDADLSGSPGKPLAGGDTDTTNTTATQAAPPIQTEWPQIMPPLSKLRPHIWEGTTTKQTGPHLGNALDFAPETLT